MKVDVIDMADAKLGNDRANRVRNYSDAIIKMYPMSNGIIQMVDNVYNIVGAPGSYIEVLRIWGHGWAGGQLIAADGSQSGWDGTVVEATPDYSVKYVAGAAL